MSLIEKDYSIRDPGGGGNQSGLRDQNARLILSYIRRHGQMPAAEIARRSGLSAQTVSNILRALETDGLLQRGDAIKGKVGKPSIPMALSPSGAYSLGLSVGRRSAELVLVDFLGQPLTSRRTSYPYPMIEDVFQFLGTSIASIQNETPRAMARIVGIGVALPGRIWDWLEVVKAPAAAMQAWKDLDLHAEIARRTGLDAVIENDATSACVAEHLLGRGREFSDFGYIFVGSFVGGGLVLNGKVVPGATGNTAALGPLPVPNGSGGTTQLLNVASLHVLERAVEASGISADVLRQESDDWSGFEAQLAPWIESTAQNLAIASAAIAAVVELEAILIDGAVPPAIRARLAEATARSVSALDLTGLAMPQIEEARVGRGARPIGAALLPIHARYFLA